MTDDNLIIFTRTFDLLAWLLPKAERFPKVYRHTVTQRMMDAALDFQEALFEAQARSGTQRLAHLRAADAHLNKLRLYLRLAHHWHWLNDGQYRHVSVTHERNPGAAAHADAQDHIQWQPHRLHERHKTEVTHEIGKRLLQMPTDVAPVEGFEMVFMALVEQDHNRHDLGF